MEEQKILTDVLLNQLNGIAEQLHGIETSLTQSAAQRQNLLRAAFAGQLVAQDPNDEPASALLERIRAERTANGTVKKTRGRKTKEIA
jgi:type I restriction enzyme S subunit